MTSRFSELRLISRPVKINGQRGDSMQIVAQIHMDYLSDIH